MNKPWEHEYKGYRYTPWDDIEPEENCKICHDVITPEGKLTHMDWSPYSSPSFADFCLWVDLGCPGRIVTNYGTRNFMESSDLQQLKDGTLTCCVSR